jgi:hypothetical protein
MELEAFVTEIDDIQCSAERHDPFADANQPQSAAFRRHTILGGSTSIAEAASRFTIGQKAPTRVHDEGKEFPTQGKIKPVRIGRVCSREHGV